MTIVVHVDGNIHQDSRLRVAAVLAHTFDAQLAEDDVGRARLLEARCADPIVLFRGNIADPAQPERPYGLSGRARVHVLLAH